MSRLNEEFAKLSAAVLPSVVSVTTKTVRPGQMSWHPFFGLIGERAQVIPGLGSGRDHQQGGPCRHELPRHRGRGGGADHHQRQQKISRC
jgi:hypothetical protein